MKITRLKRGYRINLSDGEFDMLELCLERGRSDIDEYTPISKQGRRALGGRLMEIDAFRIDEDRRA